MAEKEYFFISSFIFDDESEEELDKLGNDLCKAIHRVYKKHQPIQVGTFGICAAEKPDDDSDYEFESDNPEEPDDPDDPDEPEKPEAPEAPKNNPLRLPKRLVRREKKD